LLCQKSLAKGAHDPNNCINCGGRTRAAAPSSPRVSARARAPVCRVLAWLRHCLGGLAAVTPRRPATVAARAGPVARWTGAEGVLAAGVRGRDGAAPTASVSL